MNRQEAQFILSAYRPGGRDAAAAAFTDALKMAEADPELRQWLAQEQKMDQLVSEKLNQVMPPADLRERILTGGRVSRQEARFGPAKWLAWAASLILFAVVATNFVHTSRRPDLRTFAINYAQAGFDLETESRDLPQLEAWLRERKMPIPGKIPVNLANLEKLGCRTAQMDGKNVSIICFKEGDHEFHLFVMRAADFAGGSVVSSPTAGKLGKWTAVGWSDAQNRYAVVSQADEATIRLLL